MQWWVLNRVTSETARVRVKVRVRYFVYDYVFTKGIETP